MRSAATSYIVVAVASCALTAAGIGWLGQADRAVPAPYADFERDLAAGKVEEVRIDGTEYRYRLRDSAARRKTKGPKATLTSIAAMHVKVSCER